jgi:hypothetical protein
MSPALEELYTFERPAWLYLLNTPHRYVHDYPDDDTSSPSEGCQQGNWPPKQQSEYRYKI